MDFANLLTAVFGIAAAIGGGLAGLLWGSLRTLRDSNGDLRDRVSDLEKTVARVEAENSEALSENKWLKTALTGKVDWAAVTDLVAEHDRKAGEHWRRDEDLLNEILTAIREA